MNDPVRLIRSDDEFARALLGSAKQDAGSERALGRALAAVSGALATLGATSTASATVGLTLVAKWLAIGALLGAATTGGVTLVEQHFSAPRAAPAPLGELGSRLPSALSEPARASAPASEPRAAETASAAPAAPAEPARAPLPTARAAESAAAESAPAPGTAASSTALERELALLEAARQSLNHGDPAGGLAALGRYRAQFPNATLGPEASLLEIQAYAERGDVASARRIGSAFLLSYPSSPYAARARSLLDTLAK